MHYVKHRHPSKEEQIDLQHELDQNKVQNDNVNTVHASVIISMQAHHPEDITDTLEQGNYTKNQVLFILPVNTVCTAN